MSKKKIGLLVVTDLHLSDSNITGRVDYRGECIRILDKIEQLGIQYKSQYDELYLILVGDVYNHSFKDFDSGQYYYGRVVVLRSIFDDIFVNIGNHEYTYYRDNPFWSQVMEVKSNLVKNYTKKSWTAKGVIPLFNVVDYVTFGDVNLYFNHYGSGIQAPQGKYNIGLFHQDITTTEIVSCVEQSLGLNVFESHDTINFQEADVLTGYNLCFLGHNHKLYGRWEFTNPITNFLTILYYLASLGRTNHTEVNDNFLERNIPLISIEGSDVSIIDNMINLSNRENTIIESIIEKNQQVYLARKERKEFLNNLAESSDPIKNISNSLVNAPLVKLVFDELVATGSCTADQFLDTKYEEVMKWI